MAAAVEHDQAEQTACWCCGNSFDEFELTRLGDHPEVAICTECARWLHRRARASADSGNRTPGAWVRRRIASVRELVIRHGLHEWPVIGGLLRRADKHLP